MREIHASCVKFTHAFCRLQIGTVKQLKRVRRVEVGRKACEFDTKRMENAYFRSRSHAQKFKSVTWKKRPGFGPLLMLSMGRAELCSPHAHPI